MTLPETGKMGTYDKFLPAVLGILQIKSPHMPQAKEGGGNNTHNIEW